jgi:prepilin-type N-terminal cleavage/methylation domain-containing protein
MKRDAGFTLVEVMVAMLIGTIGLLGTIAVQQAIVGASKNANDAAVATRLATQKLEELSSRGTDTQLADQTNGLFRIVAANPQDWSPTASGAPVPEYVNAEGMALYDNSGVPETPSPTLAARYRWQRRWKVTNTGPGLPYVISVIVTYDNDAGTPKTVRVDLERRKSW